MPAANLLSVGSTGGTGYNAGDIVCYNRGVMFPFAPVQSFIVDYVDDAGAITGLSFYQSGYSTVRPPNYTLVSPDLQGGYDQIIRNTPGGNTGSGALFNYVPADNSLLLYKEPLSYYLNLFTSQYKLSPRLNAFTAALFQPIDDLTNCLAFFTHNFDLQYAVGVQLDVIGALVGFPRTLPFQPSFSVSPVLDDTTYRLLINAKIAANNWSGTLISLPIIWKNLFPGGTMVPLDNQDMTVTFSLAGSFTSLIIDCIAGYAVNGALSGNMDAGLIVPRPEGVEYGFTFADLPILGADLDNAYIAGADLGHAS